MFAMSTKNLCNKYQLYLKNPESTISARNQLLDNCLMLLKDNERAPRRLLHTMFIDILIDSSKSATFDPDKAATAFCRIEEYVELLYRYPWKEEFWTIKYHCGFYRTMINPWLKRAEEIFKKLGYHIVNGNCFQLRKEPDSALLVDIGTQCLLASAECRLLSEACRFADSTNYMATLVLHLNNGGTSKDIVAKLRATNERMFVDPDKDLYISDLPLEYSLSDFRQNNHRLKQHPKSLQNYSHLYNPGYSMMHDIYLTHRTYTEEQQAAFDSYQRPLAQKQAANFQLNPNRTDFLQGTSAAIASPIPNLAAAKVLNSERDSAYGDSTYGGTLTQGGSSETNSISHSVLSHTSRRPREPTEHSLKKPGDDEDISPAERTLSPTLQPDLVNHVETETQHMATFSSLPLSLLSSLSGWVCKVCDSNNLTDSSVCKKCSQIRSSDPLSPPTQPIQHRNNERICEKCTLKNKVTARKCTACGQTFKGYHTAV